MPVRPRLRLPLSAWLRGGSWAGPRESLRIGAEHIGAARRTAADSSAPAASPVAAETVDRQAAAPGTAAAEAGIGVAGAADRLSLRRGGRGSWWHGPAAAGAAAVAAATAPPAPLTAR